MAENQNADFDMDALLDATLDDLADMPEFKPYPPGAYRVTLQLEKKVVNKHPSFEAKFKLVEVIELANPEAVPPEVGAEASQLYMMDNEMGQGKFKKFMQPIGKALGLGSIREIVDACKGMELTIATDLRQNKEKTQTFMDVTNVLVS